MGKNILEYKGYMTKVMYDGEEGLLYGKVEGIIDAVTFQTAKIEQVAAAFHEAVDHYLTFCENVGRRPAKAYKGQFNVRIDPELHRRLSLLAAKEEVTLNKVVESALEDYVSVRQAELS